MEKFDASEFTEKFDLGRWVKEEETALPLPVTRNFAKEMREVVEVTREMFVALRRDI